MAIDKTVISIPPLYFYQYAPNVASLTNPYTYNEGIYIKNESLSKTYAKSVVRIYKNPKLPKKIYLFSKDTSLYEAFASRYKEEDAEGLSGYTRQDFAQELYLGSDEEVISKYSLFKQPENFTSLDFTSLTGKTINFYTLTTSSIDTLGKVVESFEETSSDENIQFLIDYTTVADGAINIVNSSDDSNVASTIQIVYTALVTEYDLIKANEIFSENQYKPYINNIMEDTYHLYFVTEAEEAITSINNIIQNINDIQNIYLQNIDVNIWAITPTIYAEEQYLNKIQTSYYLKSKSIIADYNSDSKTYTKTFANLFEEAVYTNWPGTDAITQLAALNETDIQLYKSTTINKTKQFDFSEYVEYKYDNLWVQKADRYLLVDTRNGPEVYDNYVFLDPYNVDSSTGPRVLREDTEEPDEKDQILLNMKGKFCLLTKKDVHLPDTYTNRDYFVANSSTRPDSDYAYGQLNYNNTYSISALAKQEKNIFGYDYNLNFDDYSIQSLIDEATLPDNGGIDYDSIYEQKPYIFADGTTAYDRRQKQFENFSFDTGLSTLYIFNDSFQQEQEQKYGFVMDDPYSTVYELELDEELDIESGTFMVVEIE